MKNFLLQRTKTNHYKKHLRKLAACRRQWDLDRGKPMGSHPGAGYSHFRPRLVERQRQTDGISRAAALMAGLGIFGGRRA